MLAKIEASRALVIEAVGEGLCLHRNEVIEGPSRFRQDGKENRRRDQLTL
jgi:hypothetical protein